ncbi:MAG: RidA family protein [Bacteroidia bacterium]|nr:RidA family protein [Bacteroidia bacterium]
MKNILTILIFGMLLACGSEPLPQNFEMPELSDRNINSILDSLNIELPELSTPLANYVHTVRTGDLVFTSGKGPRDDAGDSITGKVGVDMTWEEGYDAARSVGLQQLAALKLELGDLRKVKRIVKVLGMVNAHADFKDQSKVINGFSDLMVEVFGEAGKHARSAVGMGSLPNNIAVEIEMIVQVYPD